MLVGLDIFNGCYRCVVLADVVKTTRRIGNLFEGFNGNIFYCMRDLIIYLTKNIFEIVTMANRFGIAGQVQCGSTGGWKVVVV